MRTGTKETILQYTYDLAKALGVVGLVNIQFVIYNDQVYVIEVNPRSSRTIPYISKVTGVPIIDLATRVMLGQKLKRPGLRHRASTRRRTTTPSRCRCSPSRSSPTWTPAWAGDEVHRRVPGPGRVLPQALLKAFKGASMKAPKGRAHHHYRQGRGQGRDDWHRQGLR